MTAPTTAWQVSRPPRVHAWRDVDNTRPTVGLEVHSKGLSLRLGRRLYRLRWSL